jgi:hypothetical protein
MHVTELLIGGLHSLICFLISVLHLEKKHEEGQSLVHHLWKEKLLSDYIYNDEFFTLTFSNSFLRS